MGELSIETLLEEINSVVTEKQKFGGQRNLENNVVGIFWTIGKGYEECELQSRDESLMICFLDFQAISILMYVTNSLIFQFSSALQV